LRFQPPTPALIKLQATQGLQEATTPSQIATVVKLLQDNGCKFTVPIYKALIRSYERTNQEDKIHFLCDQIVFEQKEMVGYKLHRFARSSVQHLCKFFIATYQRLDNPDRIRQILNHIPQQEQMGDAYRYFQTKLFLLRSFLKSHQPAKAYPIFNEILFERERKVRNKIRTRRWVASSEQFGETILGFDENEARRDLIREFGKIGDVSKLVEIVASVTKDQRNIDMANVLLKAFARNGKWKDVDDILVRIERSGLCPNVETFYILLRHSYECGNKEQLEKYLGEMSRKELDWNTSKKTQRLKAFFEEKGEVKIVEELKYLREEAVQKPKAPLLFFKEHPNVTFLKNIIKKHQNKSKVGRKKKKIERKVKWLQKFLEENDEKDLKEELDMVIKSAPQISTPLSTRSLSVPPTIEPDSNTYTRVPPPVELISNAKPVLPPVEPDSNEQIPPPAERDSNTNLKEIKQLQHKDTRSTPKKVSPPFFFSL